MTSQECYDNPFFMFKSSIRDLPKHMDQNVELKGWVYNTRSSGKVKFLMLRDGSGLCQCVFFEKDCGSEAMTIFSQLTQEACVKIIGTTRSEPRSPGAVELSVSEVKILAPSTSYPITPKEHGTAFLMNNRHLWLRSKRQVAIMQIRSRLVNAARNFFDSNNFTLVDSPILTPNACEGTSTLFKTHYGDDPIYLSQTGQLYLEPAAAALGKVYCFGPTFRAEKSKTRRHLLEFWMIEPEVAFADLNDNMDLAENFLEYCVQNVLRDCEDQLKVLERDTTILKNTKAPFNRIHYKEAVEIGLRNNPDLKSGEDFGAPDETFISEQFDKPVFIHRYPTAIKAFYMKEDPEDSTYCLSCDLLAPEGYGEIIGGGQREESLDVLLKKIEDEKLNLDHFQWYLDVRRYGSFPHSGFGMGIERCLSWICGLTHVRETIPFARMYGRLSP